MILIKRAYEPASIHDGYRVLIDRLWPRGMKKANLQMDEWAKDLAPSNELRKAFHAHPNEWLDFQRRYREELRTKTATEHLNALACRARKGRLTLLSSAKDLEHNHVPVLQRLIDAKSRRQRSANTKRQKS